MNIKGIENLNAREAKLFEFLCVNCNRHIKRKDIARALPKEYPMNGNIYFEASGKTITKDIREINSKVSVTIISNPYKGIKVATEEELKEYLLKEQIKLAKMWGRLHKKTKKAGLHNQLEIKMNGDVRVFNAYLSEVRNG